MFRIWAHAALGAALLGAAAHAAPVYGDANGSSTLTAADVVTLARIAGGLASASKDVVRYSDVAPVVNNTAGQFGDGRITVTDVVRVARQVANPALPDFPAKVTAYAAQEGNTFTVRKYDEDGNPKGDEVATAGAPTQQVVSGVTYVINPLDSSEGQQRLTSEKIVDGNVVPFTDAQGRAALGATQLSFGGTVTPFDPPLVLVVYPFQAGTTWSGTTKTVISGQSVSVNYTGTVSAVETLDVPAGHFDNAWKVSLDYSGKLGFITANGTDTFWFVPYLGPIRHGYTRTITFAGTTTVMPDAELAAATVHGAHFP